MATELVVADELSRIESYIEERICLIEQGEIARAEIERAIRRVKDERLYALEYTSFEVYVRQRWGKSKSWAYGLLAAETTPKKVALDGNLGNKRPEVDENTPDLHEEEKAAIVVESLPAPAELEPKKSEPAIPSKLLPAFNEAKAFTVLVRQCGEMRTELDRLAQSPAGAFLAEGMTRIIADLGNLQRAIKFAKPHAICPYCKGKGCTPKSGLKAPCRGTGWVVRGVQGDGQ